MLYPRIILQGVWLLLLFGAAKQGVATVAAVSSVADQTKKVQFRLPKSHIAPPAQRDVATVIAADKMQLLQERINAVGQAGPHHQAATALAKAIIPLLYQPNAAATVTQQLRLYMQAHKNAIPLAVSAFGPTLDEVVTVGILAALAAIYTTFDVSQSDPEVERYLAIAAAGYMLQAATAKQGLDKQKQQRTDINQKNTFIVELLAPKTPTTKAVIQLERLMDRAITAGKMTAAEKNLAQMFFQLLASNPRLATLQLQPKLCVDQHGKTVRKPNGSPLYQGTFVQMVLYRAVQALLRADYEYLIYRAGGAHQGKGMLNFIRAAITELQHNPEVMKITLQRI